MSYMYVHNCMKKCGHPVIRIIRTYCTGSNLKSGYLSNLPLGSEYIHILRLLQCTFYCCCADLCREESGEVDLRHDLLPPTVSILWLRLNQVVVLAQLAGGHDHRASVGCTDVGDDGAQCVKACCECEEGREGKGRVIREDGRSYKVEEGKEFNREKGRV